MKPLLFSVLFLLSFGFLTAQDNLSEETKSFVIHEKGYYVLQNLTILDGTGDSAKYNQDVINVLNVYSVIRGYSGHNTMGRKEIQAFSNTNTNTHTHTHTPVCFLGFATPHLLIDCSLFFCFSRRRTRYITGPA